MEQNIRKLAKSKVNALEIKGDDKKIHQEEKYL
jgi:hypothetical protein